MSGHGTRKAYKDGCRCDACREAQAAYFREYRRARGAVARITKDEARYRLGEIEHLLAGGVWPPEACRRVGWTVSAALYHAAAHGRERAAFLLQAVA